MAALHILVLFAVVSADNEADHITQAEAALTSGDLATGKAELERALANDPQDVDALWGLGLVSLQQGDPQSASTQFEALLTLDPYNDSARLKLAQAQWMAGQAAKADGTLNELLGRHPESKDGLALRARMSGESGIVAPSHWRPTARAEIRSGYDSNMTLANGAVTRASQLNAPLAAINVAGGIMHTGADRPLTAFIYVGTQTGLSDRDATERVMPSFVGLSVTGRKPLGPIHGILDLRYQELFVDTFSDHVERLIAPSLGASYTLNDQHTLRLLGGTDIRQPTLVDDAATNVTARAAVRDTISLGRLGIMVDLGGRHNFDTNASDPMGALTGFGEIFLLGYGQYSVTTDFTAFALLNAQFRNFKTGPEESTYGGQAGVRYALFEAFELHGEYGYTQNLSNAVRSYKRHQVSAGVRFWYP